ncbi:MAG: peptidoglycan-binding protein [Candidatus Paceibacterota bacterium]|jgi:hypothetical protein
MKKIISFVLPLTIFVFAIVIVVMPNNVSAQTAVECPVGYTCTPITVTPVAPSPIPVPIPPTTVYPSCYVFSTNLQIGSKGADVVALQTWLIEHGFDIPAITQEFASKGYFGPATASVVKKYQASVGIESTGYFGPETRARVNGECGGGIVPTSNIFTFISQNIASNAGVVDVASSSLTGKVVFKMKAIGGDMTKPVASDFDVVFSSPSVVIPIQPIITVTPNDTAIAESGEYTVIIAGTLYSNNPSVPAGSNIYQMLIKSAKYHIIGKTVSSQLTPYLKTTQASLFKSGSSSTQSSVIISQNSINFSANQGDTQYQQKSLTITNTSSTNISFNISVPNQPSWLNVSYNTNTMIAYPNSPVGIGASLDPKSLSVGTYSTNIILTGNFQGSPINIPVKVTILPQSATSTTNPEVSASPASVSSGGTSFIRFTMPANTVSATLTLSCPFGVSVKGYDSMRNIVGSEELCSKNQNISIYASGEEIMLTNTSLVSTNIVVANFSVYTLDNPNYARTVSVKITVAPTQATQPSITVLSPNGGEVWSIGNKYTIKWSSTNLKQNNVRIGIVDSRSGVNAGGDIVVTPNTGSYMWTVPQSIGNIDFTSNTLPIYKIAVSSENVVNGDFAADLSNKPFTITSQTTKPYITSVAGKAAGNGEIDAGGTVGIQGTNLLGYKDSTNVYIGGQVCTITQLSNTLIYCTAPSTLQVGSVYDLYINTTGMGGDKVTSNIVKVKVLSNVSKPSITVLSPNGGESFVAGGNLTGSFASNNLSVGNTYEVALVGQGYDRDIGYGLITSTSVDKQSLSVNIPNDVPAKENYYRVRLVVGCNNSGELCVQDQSDRNFTITSSNTKPSITIQSPRGEETYKIGDKVKVKWETRNISSNAYLDIIRLRNLNLQQEYSLASPVINDGNETVTIPSVPAGTYTLEIKSSVKGYVDAITGSSGKFTITSPNSQPSITVLSPNGGEIYRVGNRVNVNWSIGGSIPTSWPTDNVGRPQVIIDLYTSGGNFVQHLSALHGGGPTFPFDIPNVLPGNYVIRVWAVNNLPYFGQSGTFTITSATQNILTVSVAPSSVQAASAGTSNVDLLDVDLNVNTGVANIAGISVTDISPNNKTNLTNLWLSGSNLAGARITGVTRSIPLVNSTYPNAMQYDFDFPTTINIIAGQPLHLHVMGDVTSRASGYIQLQSSGVGYNDSTLKVNSVGQYGNRIQVCQLGQFWNGSSCVISTPANRPPVISGGTFPTTLNVGETGTWRVNASDPENGPISYEIDWGDTGAGSATPPLLESPLVDTHLYSSAGTYTVKFTVTDNGGLSAQTTATVQINSQTTSTVTREAVRQLYLTLLRREPDQQGWDYWMKYSSNIDVIKQAIMNTTEYRNLQLPTVTLSATSVASSDAVAKSYTVKWSSTNMNSCTLTTNATKGDEDSDNWSGYIGPVNTSGSITAPVSGSLTVTVTCTGSAGSTSKSVTLTGNQAYAPSNSLNAAIWDAIREYFRNGGR